MICGRVFNINRLRIHPFSLSHDAADPAGFTLHNNGVKIGIATDLGMVTGMVREHLKNCQTIILEANHDPHMLINGPYPWPLKQRISGRSGHLSNDTARDLLAELKHQHLQQVILAHLSEENNLPGKALDTIAPVLSGTAIRIDVAHQHRASRIFRVKNNNK
jgi:phosphoribosyl 1,2-cyclic phosphodiesterase